MYFKECVLNDLAKVIIFDGLALPRCKVNCNFSLIILIITDVSLLMLRISNEQSDHLEDSRKPLLVVSAPSFLSGFSGLQRKELG